MNLKQICTLALSMITLSSCATTDAGDSYSLSDNGYKCLVNSEGTEIVALDDHLANISSARAYKDKLVVIGDLEYGQLATIIDTKKNEIVDKFLHFYLSNPWDEAKTALQSPSGRYLLFRKFHSVYSSEDMTSNFVMIYDLEKSALKNRILDDCNPPSDIESPKDVEACPVVLSEVYAGEFFFPINEDFSCSTCSAYKTVVYDDENYAFILGNKWEEPKTVLQVNYPKVGLNNFLIVEETKDGLSKKIIDFKTAKLLDKDGKTLEYTEELEEKFYMVDFAFDGDTLTITNLADYSPVEKIILEIK